MTNKQATSKTRTDYAADVDVSDWQAKQRRDPEFMRAYEELRPEFEVAEQVIKLRLQQKMTQAELARHSGTRQSGIARLERGRGAKNLGFIQRVANSLNASVHVSLEPRTKKAVAKKTAAKKAPTKAASPASRVTPVKRKRSRAATQARASRPTTRRK